MFYMDLVWINLVPWNIDFRNGPSNLMKSVFEKKCTIINSIKRTLSTAVAIMGILILTLATCHREEMKPSAKVHLCESS